MSKHYFLVIWKGSPMRWRADDRAFFAAWGKQYATLHRTRATAKRRIAASVQYWRTCDMHRAERASDYSIIEATP